MHDAAAAAGGPRGALGGLDVAIALTERHLQIFFLLSGIYPAFMGVMFAFLLPRSMARQAGRLEKLRDELSRRYGDLSALDPSAE